MRAVQKRKAFINNHPKKLELTRKIINARPFSKIITFSNDDTNPSYSESINRLLDMEKVLSDIDGETDVVFGHYIHTGKQEKTLITADDYIFSIDNISEEGYIKFDIHYDYLNI